MIIPYAGIRLRLHPDWKHIVTQAWSMRGVAFTAAISATDSAMTFAADGRIGVAAIVFVVSVATGIARVVHQEKVSGPIKDADSE